MALRNGRHDRRNEPRRCVAAYAITVSITSSTRRQALLPTVHPFWPRGPEAVLLSEGSKPCRTAEVSGY